MNIDIIKNEEIVDKFLEEMEKGEKFRAVKGAILAAGLAIGAQGINQQKNPNTNQQISQEDLPNYARSMSTIDPKKDVKDLAYKRAKKEANGIVYKNDKNWFLKNHAEGLSPHVYKQTIKSNPDLNNKYGYINKLSNSTFKEIIQKNPHLREDVHSNYYDRLHKEFDGDHNKMVEAWKNGIKATRNKYSNLSNNKDKESLDNVNKEVTETN